MGVDDVWDETALDTPFNRALKSAWFHTANNGANIVIAVNIQPPAPGGIELSCSSVTPIPEEGPILWQS